MRYFNIIIYLLLFVISKSQNLVPNGSFETYTNCPTFGSQIYYASPWIGKDNNSVDYFNACALPPRSVPYSGAGFQYAKDGVAYGALWAYNGVNNNYREYAQIQLTSSLIANNNYYIRFYINQYQLGKYSVNSMGAAITTTAIGITGGIGSVLNYSSSILKYGNPIISDTLNWVEISGVYKALGGEQYLTIGNFHNDINTDTLAVNYSNYPGAYYYLDDVSLTNVTTPQWQYRDTTITLGDSVLIGPAITGLNVDWFTMNSTFIKNAPAIYVKPTLTTSYSATETFNSVVYNHTVTVTVLITKVDEDAVPQNSVRLFPNPTTNNFSISNLPESSKLKVDITDTQGKLHSTELITITNNKATIKTDLPNGVYIVSITNTISGLKVVKKLIVQK